MERAGVHVQPDAWGQRLQPIGGVGHQDGVGEGAGGESALQGIQRGGTAAGGGHLLHGAAAHPADKAYQDGSFQQLAAGAS